MNEADRRMRRRTLLAGAGVAASAALIASRPARSAPPSDEAMWSREYWAKKGDVALSLWRKRRGAPRPGEAPLPVLFLVHGSSLSARPTFDLATPGRGEYSVMNVFA